MPPFLQSPTLQEEELTSSSSESDSEEDVPAARRFKRFGQFSMHRAGLRDHDNDDDDEDEAPAFLPSTHHTQTGSRDRAGPELDNTLRQNASRATPSRRQADRPAAGSTAESESSTSSMSSGAPVVVQGPSRRSGQGAGKLGPQRVGEPPRLSPRKSNASGRGSDGTPSMGSSFSDLDGESATSWIVLLQSAD